MSGCNKNGIAPAAKSFSTGTAEEDTLPSQFGAEKSIDVAPEEEALLSLPSLEDLVKRVPAETRQLIDELFRARFVGVRRVPKSSLPTSKQ